MERETVELLRSVCHDLRAPIRAIREECHRHRCAAPPRDTVDLALDQMSGILDDLNAYIHTGINGGERCQVDLNECLALALSSTPGVRDLQVEIEFLPVIGGYKVQLVRLFQNLLSNAAKYAGLSATVNVHAEMKAGYWHVCFCDDGPGIPPDQYEHIFKPMHRLHGWWDVPGSGLGLAACRHVLELHSGQITAGAAPGGGARFTFTLPTE